MFIKDNSKFMYKWNICAYFMNYILADYLTPQHAEQLQHSF